MQTGVIIKKMQLMCLVVFFFFFLMIDYSSIYIFYLFMYLFIYFAFIRKFIRWQLARLITKSTMIRSHMSEFANDKAKPNYN